MQKQHVFGKALKSYFPTTPLYSSQPLGYNYPGNAILVGELNMGIATKTRRSVNDVRYHARTYAKRYGLKKMNIGRIYDIKNNWQDTWPNCDSPGCYAIFDKNKLLLYVGKASHSNTLALRLACHFRCSKTGSKGIVRQSGWSHAPWYVITIGVDKAHEAPSLEEYLITKLNPSDNINGKI